MSVTDILKKLIYIEAEMEIQKQILHSIPSEQTTDIEETLGKIAKAKNDVIALKNTLQQVSPAEYAKLLSIEKAVSSFNALSRQAHFASVENLATSPHCSLTVSGGICYSCLVKAKDESGNYTIVTLDGELLTFAKDEVIEEDD